MSDGARWRLNVRVACLFHDIGKANEHFVRAVTSHQFEPQAIRHEHLSALVLMLPAIRGWLATNPSLDLDAITAGVLSHHIKAAPGGDHGWYLPAGNTRVGVWFEHAEVRAILDRVAEVASLRAPPPLPTDPCMPGGVWERALRAGYDAAKRLRISLQAEAGGDERKRFIAAVKAGVILADGAASGLAREGISFAEWVDAAAHTPDLTGDEVAEKVIAPRVAEVERQRGEPFTWQRFQLDAATLGDRALLMAACGAGKTLAAWKWAESVARTRRIGKVIFLYPTRGTATEGFRDYVSWAPEAEATLLHGTAESELAGMMDNNDEKEHLRARDYRPRERDERLFALGFWSRRFFSATVDQFLSFMENGYRGVCLLPALADAAVIFDEVHSFDVNTFHNLREFLAHFDVPVLCMTATLPKDRQTALEGLGLRLHPSPEDRARYSDLEAQEAAPRYRLDSTLDRRHALDVAIEAWRGGARVLWVVNTVARCQALATSLQSTVPELLCYHSRFTLGDRKRRHGDVVRAFQQRGGASFAVTTQVCEMSLDLDADVLITELAPATALVQRFGRAHRRLRGGHRARLFTYTPESAPPYTREDIDLAGRFIAALPTEDLSQRVLADRLQEFARREAGTSEWARFLDSGYYATPGSLRDPDGDRSAQAVLPGAVSVVRARSRSKESWDELIIPCPRKQTVDAPEGLPAWLRVVSPYATYDAELGLIANDMEVS